MEYANGWVHCQLHPSSHSRGHSPLYPLHHVCYQFVRDAWAGLLSQAKGILQLFHSSHIASSLLVLIFKLQPRNGALVPYLTAESSGQTVQYRH